MLHKRVADSTIVGHCTFLIICRFADGTIVGHCTLQSFSYFRWLWVWFSWMRHLITSTHKMGPMRIAHHSCCCCMSICCSRVSRISNSYHHQSALICDLWFLYSAERRWSGTEEALDFDPQVSGFLAARLNAERPLRVTVPSWLSSSFSTHTINGKRFL